VMRIVLLLCCLAAVAVCSESPAPARMPFSLDIAIDFKSIADRFASEIEALGDTLMTFLNDLKFLNHDPAVQLPQNVYEEVDIDHFAHCVTQADSRDVCFHGTGAMVAILERHELLKRGFGGRDHTEDNMIAVIDADNPEELPVVLGEVEELQLLDVEEEVYDVIVKKSDIQVGGRLGQGGFKTVHTGEYKGNRVAVGVVTTKSGGSHLTPREVTMLEQEIAITETIRETIINRRYICRSYIPRLIGTHKVKTLTGKIKSYYLVMELGKGDINKKTFSSSKNHAYGAAFQMVAGLHCVHEAGYIHKDVKPLNTLESADGNFLWTNDFGLTAKIVGDDANLAGRSGTPYYMPSERASISLQRYDVFALGISFDDLGISGHLPADLILSMKHSTWDKRPSPIEILNRLVLEIMKPFKKRVDDAEMVLTTTSVALGLKETTLRTHVEKRDAVKAIPAAAVLERAITKAREDLLAYSERLAHYKSKAEKIEFQKDAKLEEIERMKARISAIETSLAAAMRERDVHRGSVKTIRVARTEAEGKVKRLNAMPIDDRNGFIRALNFTDAFKGHTTVDARVNATEALASVKAKYQAAKSAHKLAADQVTTLTESLRERNEDTKIVVGGLTVSLKEMEVEYTTAIGKRIEKEGMVNRLTSEIAAVQEKLATTHRRNDELATLEKAVVDAKAARDAAAVLVETARTTLASIRSTVQEITERLGLQRTPDELYKSLIQGIALTV